MMQSNYKIWAKKISGHNYYIRKLLYWLYSILNKDTLHLINHGCSKLRKDIIGTNNSMVINEGSFIDNISIIIHGNNNRITIGKNCRIGPDCKIRIDGDCISVEIGDSTTFTRNVELCAQENGTKITMGSNCMLSNSIVIRTSDSHPIFDMNNMRINPAGNVIIEDNVWIAPNSKIMKCAVIGHGAIIGSDTTVSKYVPANCLYVGRPGKVVKENVYWTREKLFS